MFNERIFFSAIPICVGVSGKRSRCDNVDRKPWKNLLDVDLSTSLTADALKVRRQFVEGLQHQWLHSSQLRCGEGGTANLPHSFPVVIFKVEKTFRCVLLSADCLAAIDEVLKIRFKKWCDEKVCYEMAAIKWPPTWKSLTMTSFISSGSVIARAGNEPM